MHTAAHESRHAEQHETIRDAKIGFWDRVFGNKKEKSWKSVALPAKRWIRGKTISITTRAPRMGSRNITITLLRRMREKLGASSSIH